MRLLSYARRSAGFSQRQLAERSGIPQPAIARIESGRSTPRLDTLAASGGACKTLKARVSGVPEKVPFRMARKPLEGGHHFTFETRAGNLDILGCPAGSGGFDSLARTAQEMEIAKGLKVHVADVR